MQMTPMLGVGIVLILLGVAILWRDFRKDRQRLNIANGPGHDTAYDHISLADVEIRSDEQPAAMGQSGAAVAQGSVGAVRNSVENSALSELRETISKVHEDVTDEDRERGDRSAKTVAAWNRLQARVEETVQAINSVLGEVGIVIAQAGQNGWSFNNRGFGSFRRVMLAGESVAWLRMELTTDNRFICALRCHGDEKSALNADETVSAMALSDQRIASLISVSMQPITKYAARSTSKNVSEQDVAKTLWHDSEQLVAQALTSAASALEESGSGLEVFEGAEWDKACKRYRLSVRVMFNAALVAKLYVDRPTPQHIECLVVPVKEGAVLGSQRQRVAVEGLQMLELAEVIVNCVWPSIEHAWNLQHQGANVPA